MFFQRNMALGLDIGTHTTKIVQIDKSGKFVRVNQVLALPTPKDAFAEGNLVKPELLAGLLLDAADKYKLYTKRVFGVVPERHVISRQVRMPLMPEDEIASALQWEVEKYIPVPRNDLVLDFIKVGEETGENGAETVIQLIAAPKKVIYPYCNVMTESNFKPKALETIHFALHRSLSLGDTISSYEDKPPIFACIDLGASGTNIVVFRGEVPDFSRNIPIGGNYLTETIAQILGISESEAEEIKHEKAEILSNSSVDEIDNSKIQIDLALRPILSELARELRRCLDYCKMKWKGQGIDGFYLTGGTALLKGLPHFMAEQLELPVKIGNPVNCLGGILDPNTPKSQLLKISPVFSVAMGLALREVI